MSVYLLVTAIPLIFVGVYLNSGIRNVVLNNAIFETESNLDKIEIRLESALNRITDISDLIYLNRDLEALLTSEYNSTLDVYNAYSRYRIFDDYLRYYDEIENIQFFMDRDMITDSHFIHANANTVAQEWFQEAVEKRGRISWLVMEEHWTKNRYLALTRSVYDQQNQFLGVLSIYFSSDKLREIIDPEIHDAFIILDENEIVYSNNIRALDIDPQFVDALFSASSQGETLFDDEYLGEDVKVNLRRLQPSKSLMNELQIATVIPVESLMEQPSELFNRGYWIMFTALAISILAFQIFIKTFHHRINTLKLAMGKVARGEFNIKPTIAGKDEIGEAYQELHKTSQSIQTLIDEVYVHKIKEERWRRKQKESEFKMLSSQINPHFLYNTLEMIRMKAIVNQDKEVALLIKKLSKMMRSALERTDRPIPLIEEINLIETYLEIQSMRFGDKLTYQIDVGEAITDFYIFPLLIQPIVENAIIHGLEPQVGEGHLAIQVKAFKNYFEIMVRDNGIGMDDQRLAQVQKKLVEGDNLDGKRIGVRNVHHRIQLYYGKEYGLSISSRLGHGTTVKITLPIIK